MHETLQPQEVNIGDALKMALAWYQEGLFAQAEDVFRKVNKVEPSNFEALNGIGLCRASQEAYAEALPWFDEAMAVVRDQMFALTCNRAMALGELDRSREALELYQSILARDPNNELALLSRGLVLMQMGDYKSGLASVEQALAINPTDMKARFARGFCNLVMGNLREGFKDYECRQRDVINEPKRPQWTGAEDLSGKRILLYGEQGQGDTIMFARYIPLLIACGAQVFIFTTGETWPLLVTHPGVKYLDGTYVHSEQPPFDYWIRFMSLAAAFATDHNTVPKAFPVHDSEGRLYQVTQRRRKQLEKWAGGEGYYLVGLCWAGSRKSKYDRHRSIPLADMLPLLNMPGFKFVSLQQDIRETDQAIFANAVADGKLFDTRGELRSFVDTYTLMRALDCVVSVDTSVAHMAGTALVWTYTLVSAFRAYWLWVQGQETSAWYPTMRIVRQKKDGEWSPVIQSVIKRLSNLRV